MADDSGISLLEPRRQWMLTRDRIWIGCTLAALIVLSWSWLVPTALDRAGPMSGLAA